MEFGIDPQAFVGDGDAVYGKVGLFFGLGVLGLVGRMIFVAWGSEIASKNPLKNFSGPAFIALAVAIFGFVMLRDVPSVKQAEIFVRTHTVDYVLVDLMQRDSCVIEGDAYCVVVFEDGREMVVNWYDRRVYMWEILNPDTGAPWEAPRPPSRPVVQALSAPVKIAS